MEPKDLGRIAWVRGLAESGAAKSIRIAAGASIPETARAISCSVSTLWRWENRQRVPSAEPALRYADVLEALLGKRP